MSEEVLVEVKPEVEQVVEQKVETPKPLLRRVIQPKDEAGNPVGSPHVYTGTTEQEVMDKMADAIANGTLKIRKMTLAEKMREIKPEGTPPPPEMGNRELTADELFKIKNSDNPVEAYREIYKAEFGRTPAQDREARKEMEELTFMTAVGNAAAAFIEETPEYYRSDANKIAIVNLINARYSAGHKDWSPTSIKTYKNAFAELSADGLLETAPQPEPEVIPVKEEVKPVVAESAPRTEAPVKREKTAFPSSLSRDQASGTGTTKLKEPSAAEQAMWTSDKLRAYLESKGMWGK